MSTVTDEPLRVLQFWRDLEIFNIPKAPTSRDNTPQTKVTTLRRKGRSSTLPWNDPKYAPTESHAYVHLVYVGVADVEDLARLLLQAVLPKEQLAERELQRLTGEGWLAAFVADEHGVPRPESYLAASFAQGVQLVREEDSLENINARLARAREEFAQRCHELVPVEANSQGETAKSAPSGTSLDWDRLDAERGVICALLGEEAANASALDWRVVVRTTRIKRSKLRDNLEAATDFLNSFYLDDLDRLINQASHKKSFGAALTRYLGTALKPEGRVDILTQHASMAGLVSAARLPSGRWPAPSKYPLVLAQQAAVFNVLHTLGQKDGIIGVNGPPGTGKTTLLCDVIAEIVTERARRIAQLNRPVELFDERTTVAGKTFSPIKPSIIDGTSIVVTSNNNNAVKNITQELPARGKISEEFGPVAYFDEVIREVFRAQKVLDDEKNPIEGWGVIAAALGNVSNRRSFAAGFFRDEAPPKPRTAAPSTEQSGEANDSADTVEVLEEEDVATAQGAKDTRPPTLKQLLEAASNEYQRYQDEWRAAKRAFLELQAEFERQRTVLFQAEKAALELDRSHGKLAELQTKLNTFADRIVAQERGLEQLRERRTDQRALVQAQQATLAQLQAASLPNLWDRLVALFGRETSRMATRRQALEAPTRVLADLSAELATVSRAVARGETELVDLRGQEKSTTTELAALTRQRASHQRALEAGYATGAQHFPDAAFWSLPAEQRHRASMAVGQPLDQLRARLFLQAIELHRLTILANAGKFIGNLRLVNGMLTNGLQDKLPPEQRPLLWNVLFFIVPVVSTTLASFDRLFIGMGQDSLGWLLIDEAGQATPQSAAGAIWRSRRAVIVGDPLQIEPVFTVPLSLTETLRQRHGVAPAWSPANDESVQTLADRITPFGSWVSTDAPDSGKNGESGTRIWTGMPLRTHRRCDDPMFSVANAIAYAGQMVQGRVDAEGRPQRAALSCVLGDSAWWDVSATRIQHPVSHDELDVLIDRLAQLQREPALVLPDGKAARIYVISPFKKVAQACSTRLRDANIKGIDYGTVHTFQGKEADIVFLVLGTAPGQQGAGARQWAANKPNLLNVAMTRAKARLYVIGDASQWRGLPYFRELHDALPVQRVEPVQRQNDRASPGAVTDLFSA
ncbi:AAA domain-containing protein [Ralstonia pseudosolanacearum]|uniref:AAA domain-containing protein n=1 Tax=Ralstonia pseudosolanacearum TaxID=1310165 RepID=UPI0040544527